MTTFLSDDDTLEGVKGAIGFESEIYQGEKMCVLESIWNDRADVMNGKFSRSQTFMHLFISFLLIYNTKEYGRCNSSAEATQK